MWQMIKYLSGITPKRFSVNRMSEILLLYFNILSQHRHITGIVLGLRTPARFINCNPLIFTCVTFTRWVAANLWSNWDRMSLNWSEVSFTQKLGLLDKMLVLPAHIAKVYNYQQGKCQVPLNSICYFRMLFNKPDSLTHTNRSFQP